MYVLYLCQITTRLQSGSQTWQWKTPRTGGFHGKLIYKWMIFYIEIQNFPFGDEHQ